VDEIVLNRLNVFVKTRSLIDRWFVITQYPHCVLSNITHKKKHTKYNGNKNFNSLVNIKKISLIIKIYREQKKKNVQKFIFLNR